MQLCLDHATKGLKRRRSDGEVPKCLGATNQILLPLTRENLRNHTKSFPKSAEPGDATEGTTEGTTKTSRTKTTDMKFPQKLHRNHVVYGQSKSSPPTDFDAIREQLDRDRRSVSPTSDDYRDYLEDVDEAINEKTLGRTAFAHIKKNPPKNLPTRYVVLVNQEWSDVGESSVSRGLSKPKPDHAESFVVDDVPETVLSSLGPYIQPSQHDFIMPKFAVELKGKSGNFARAEAQTAYDGAVMTEAAIAQEKYLGNQPPYGETQAITATFEGGKIISIQANHAIKDVKGTTKYHNKILFNDTPTTSKEQFKVARRHFRNAQDWGRERSEQTLQALLSRPSDLTPVDEPPVLESPVHEPPVDESDQPSSSKRPRLSHR